MITNITISTNIQLGSSHIFLKLLKVLKRSTLSYMLCKKVHFFLTSRITDTLSGVEKVHIALYAAPEFWKKSGPFFPKKSKVVQAHHLAPPNWRP